MPPKPGTGLSEQHTARIYWLIRGFHMHLKTGQKWQLVATRCLAAQYLGMPQVSDRANKRDLPTCFGHHPGGCRGAYRPAGVAESSENPRGHKSRLCQSKPGLTEPKKLLFRGAYHNT